MSIFDTLRYPISTIPTAGELNALPNDFFDKFIKKYGDGTPAASREVALYFTDDDSWLNRAELLRRELLEYDSE